jgi:hypothetical protein
MINNQKIGIQNTNLHLKVQKKDMKNLKNSQMRNPK